MTIIQNLSIFDFCVARILKKGHKLVITSQHHRRRITDERFPVKFPVTSAIG